MSDAIPPQTLEFYSTGLMDCPYLPGRKERKLLTELVAGPEAQVTYDTLARYGFRRSHNWAYRTACPDCSACVPVRLAVQDFKPSRSMRRCANKHTGWRAEPRPPVATAEQFELFSRYVKVRHGDGEMSSMDICQYRSMLEETTIDTVLVEFRHADRLMAGIIVDRVQDGLSAVYSFYDPSLSESGPGTFMVLWLAQETRRLGLPHMYLGYWVANCRKMDYKIRFRPLQALGAGGWRIISPPDWHPPLAATLQKEPE